MEAQQEINSALDFIQSAYVFALTSFTSKQCLSGIVKFSVGNNQMLLNC